MSKIKENDFFALRRKIEFKYCETCSKNFILCVYMNAHF